MIGRTKMKKLVYFVTLITLLLSACKSATEFPVSTNTINPSATSTNTLRPTATESPTGTPVISTATFSPLEVNPVSAHPLTLTEFNAGTEMKRLNVIGTGTAHDLEFSPDGTRLAIATGRGIYLYDGSTFEQNGFINVNDSVSAIAFSPDGNVLAVAVDGKVSLWNILSGQQIMSLDGELVSIYKLAFGKGGYVAAIGGACRGCGSPQQAMILWNAKTGRQIYSQRNIWFTTIALLFSSDGERLIFGGGGVKVIETKTGSEISSYNSGGSLVSAAIDVPFDIVFYNDEEHLLVTSYEESSEIFDFSTQKRTSFPLCQINLVNTDSLGACSKEKEIIIFDLASGNEIQSIEIDIDAPSLGDMFVLSPDNNFLVYYGKTGVNVVNIQAEEEVAIIQLTDFRIAESGIIEFDGKERYALATLTYSGQVEIYDIQTGVLLGVLISECCEIKGFNFSPDRRSFATIETNILKVWDLQSGIVLYERDLKDNFSGPIVFSPNGSSVFLTNIAEDDIVELNLQSGQSANHGQNSYAYDFADPFAVENYHFNEMGNLVMLGFDKSNGKYEPSFEDVRTKENIVLPVEIKSDFDYVEAFSFSADGQYVAFGNPTDIFVWNIETLELQSILAGHEFRGADGWFGKIRDLVFNPQSNLLVSVGEDGTIRLWNARFGNQLRQLNVCCSVDFTPDGRYLITYGNGVAYVWGIP